MTKATLHTQTSALPAIAAALALLSTPAPGQQVQPAPSQPTTDASAPSPQAVPDTQATPAESTATATDAPDSTATTAAKPKAARAAPKRVAIGTKVTARNRVRTTNVSAAPVTAAPKAAAASATPTPAPAASTVAAQTGPKPAAPPPATRAAGSNDTALELGGGAIALLALGGAALAIARRRRREEEWYGEEATNEEYAEPVAATEAEPLEEHPVAREQPAIIAPSAFAWGSRPQGEPEAAGDGSDRRPGESWVERAYRGPSPANPSASLRARLKRAAFFDKREREVAAGKAEPVETDAGLPEARDEERQAGAEREFA